MNNTITQSLSSITEIIAEKTALQPDDIDLNDIFEKLSQSSDDKAIAKVITLLEKRITESEQVIWKESPSESSIKHYQNSFKALEKLYELKTSDERYRFKIVIPVADRPQHLKQCLDSLLTLCKSYEYGGIKNNKFNKISVLIADDSKSTDNISQHKKYCLALTEAGIDTEYFGLEEQLAVVNNTGNNIDISRIISSADSITEFSHKGASIMRNITYLKLRKDKISNKSIDNKSLIYFIDSDQEFCINSATSDNHYFAINYFHYLDHIFRNKNIEVLTGKVVGDPPVSPSVMAGNFQQDIQAFLTTIENLSPEDSCAFHHTQNQDSDDGAAYHDMANLFGFSGQSHTYSYHCTLEHEHTNNHCFQDFSKKLEQFFYGEHPTRKTFFNYGDGFSTTVKARTVYTGNYVIKPSALDHFIPFATLKLRMAGPVLGRILKNKINELFVSANLPMLHKRTIEKTRQSEFRSGVEKNNANVDLNNEFVRQFYGDIMLFSIEKITVMGFPNIKIPKKVIQTIVNQTYKDIKDVYIKKHDTILQLKSDLDVQIQNKKQWWNDTNNHSKELSIALRNFDAFLNNIESNFSENSDAYLKITTEVDVNATINTIVNAILHLSDDYKNWDSVAST
jgi:hypothetical protein